MSFTEPLLIGFGLLLFASIAFLRAKRRSTGIPSVAVSLGIAFTFIGISIALYGFDAGDIQGSIPDLLDGMKLAFLTSILGILVAIVYRLTPDSGLWVKGQAERAAAGATIDTLAAHLQAIGTALVGEGDGSLSTELKKTRLAFVEKQDDLIREFRAFAKTMAEQNTTALIEALEEVMRDFNTKINEQLGENFKRFNEGLGRMLAWQERYRQQVAELTAMFERALQGVERSEASLKTIEERSRRFTEVADRLKETIQVYDEIVQGLEDDFEAFAEMADKAGEAMPIIERNLESMTNGLKEATTAQRESIREMVRTLQDEQAALGASVKKLTEETSETIANQFEVFDQQLEEELRKALSTMGSQLASLSAKFVSDYGPLTDKLRRLVEAAGDGGNSGVELFGRPQQPPRR